MNYTQYMDLVGEAIRENNARIEEKLRECEAYTSNVLRATYPDCEIVYTRFEEDLRAGQFYAWTGPNSGHRFFKFSDCGIAPIDLVPLPTRP